MFLSSLIVQSKISNQVENFIAIFTFGAHRLINCSVLVNSPFELNFLDDNITLIGLDLSSSYFIVRGFNYFFQLYLVIFFVAWFSKLLFENINDTQFEVLFNYIFTYILAFWILFNIAVGFKNITSQYLSSMLILVLFSSIIVSVLMYFLYSFKVNVIKLFFYKHREIFFPLVIFNGASSIILLEFIIILSEALGNVIRVLHWGEYLILFLTLFSSSLMFLGVSKEETRLLLCTFLLVISIDHPSNIIFVSYATVSIIQVYHFEKGTFEVFKSLLAENNIKPWAMFCAFFTQTRFGAAALDATVFEELITINEVKSSAKILDWQKYINNKYYYALGVHSFIVTEDFKKALTSLHTGFVRINKINTFSTIIRDFIPRTSRALYPLMSPDEFKRRAGGFMVPQRSRSSVTSSPYIYSEAERLHNYNLLLLDPVFKKHQWLVSLTRFECIEMFLHDPYISKFLPLLSMDFSASMRDGIIKIINAENPTTDIEIIREGVYTILNQIETNLPDVKKLRESLDAIAESLTNTPIDTVEHKKGSHEILEGATMSTKNFMTVIQDESFRWLACLEDSSIINDEKLWKYIKIISDAGFSKQRSDFIEYCNRHKNIAIIQKKFYLSLETENRILLKRLEAVTLHSWARDISNYPRLIDLVLEKPTLEALLKNSPVTVKNFLTTQLVKKYMANNYDYDKTYNWLNTINLLSIPVLAAGGVLSYYTGWALIDYFRESTPTEDVNAAITEYLKSLSVEERDLLMKIIEQDAKQKALAETTLAEWRHHTLINLLQKQGGVSRDVQESLNLKRTFNQAGLINKPLSLQPSFYLRTNLPISGTYSSLPTVSSGTAMSSSSSLLSSGTAVSNTSVPVLSSGTAMSSSSSLLSSGTAVSSTSVPVNKTL